MLPVGRPADRDLRAARAPDGDGKLPEPASIEAMWRAWGTQLAAERPDIDAQTVEEFGTRMWTGDFVVSVDKDFVRSCSTPMLVLPGVDVYHPTATGRDIAALAPHGEVLEPWRDTPEHVEQAVEAVRRFLRTHIPEESASERDPSLT